MLDLVRELHQVEQDAQRSALRLYVDLRRDLADVLDARGVLGLRTAASPLFDAFGSRLRSEVGALARDVSGLVVEATRSELAGLGVDAGMALAVTSGQRLAIAETLERSALAWVGVVRDRVVGELLTLGPGVDLGLVRDRLLARTIEDGRVSLWRGGIPPLLRGVWELVWRLANGLRGVILGQAQQQDSGRVWLREAVATLDAKTTECCRRVDGQVVDLETPFHLTGTPRFADWMMEPPFHYYCRTVVRLVVEE